MTEFDHEDVVEQILIGLDVKDLIRCKSVCKSWHSLITSPGFINRHLNYSYHKDRCSNELNNRRISYTHLVGSSNGLICIISALYAKILVCNPLTREVRKLALLIGLSFCWGFGYDSSGDDYKVFMGSKKGKNLTCVQVLSLKSNVWRVIGEVKYKFISIDGILCNGALHWIIRDENMKKIIISYDLSKEEFKEIPHPVDARYKCTSSSYLGILKNCLCIFSRSHYPSVHVWLMKNYNVKQSWELV
ncbi:hypothetical protein L1987_67355 [Smallanthus sonchifolius]|uniref:Uncharacterized protein n=1 Tax=Smallanthus sonchifolius TaxID=185202 RepID=A0ACB9B2Y8_9ASTR|nr:hypothetical protein L1987_67355 [Smallanthus sonchifolius]